MSEDYFYSYPNRVICNVFEDMRRCHKTRNYAALLAYIEEAQSFANRMEAALSDKKDVEKWTELRDRLKKEIRALRAEKNKLKEETSDD